MTDFTQDEKNNFEIQWKICRVELEIERGLHKQTRNEIKTAVIDILFELAEKKTALKKLTKD